MVTMLAGTRKQLPVGLEAELASYRHSIFIETLHWQLPVVDGLERDQFDRPDTLYVVAKDELGVICGCARLLPTTQAYLLDEVFPHLMNGECAPHSPEVWELSRFSTKTTHETSALSREDARQHFCLLFAALVTAAMEHGATRLITFTAMGVERILRSIGMHAHRVGPPQLVDGKPVLAMWIELDAQTCQALNIQQDASIRLSH
ncbi:acyl-homoserine-lactone synthase [Rhodanobacter sp. L36]|uniref:acyl-homoserine-lactone synthase n=1 Tax=Rhodanobacter sp. L36 TaxID=1747221 RepID=UPI00131C7BE9|nr:acyl-homoserine-lactone synthase [Rhodanobacter sp. L36]